MEALKSKFYCFRTIDKQGRVMYLQHLVSPSIGGRQLSMTSFPEFGWRGQTKLEIAKTMALIQIQSCGIKEADWELVQYEMDVDTPSWSRQPEKKEYENLLPKDFKLELTAKEKEELITYQESLKS